MIELAVAHWAVPRRLQGKHVICVHGEFGASEVRQMRGNGDLNELKRYAGARSRQRQHRGRRPVYSFTTTSPPTAPAWDGEKTQR